jgi:lysophospholipase L1-like esterase
MAKTILCYGDSNTWGHNPDTFDRYPAEVRWPGVLRAELGSAYHVIEEGLCGRTTVWDDPVEDLMSGARYLYPCLKTHRPIDAVVIMLGTNDLKYRYHLSAFDIAEAAGRLGNIVRSSEAGPAGGTPKALIVCPPPITETGVFAEMFRCGHETSLGLHAEFARMGKERDFPILFADEVASSSPVDGIHLSSSAHAAIGVAVAARVRALLQAP